MNKEAFDRFARERPLVTGPSINRHRSRQDYETPKEFRQAVIKRFGMPVMDLAASQANRFSSHENNWFGVEHDALSKPWVFGGLLWLNPPYSDIAPWARKCAEESEKGAKILLLVPASVDSNWWTEFVHWRAFVLFLSPRISFDGKNPYPKPCALCCYGSGIEGVPMALPWYPPWRWK